MKRTKIELTEFLKHYPFLDALLVFVINTFLKLIRIMVSRREKNSNRIVIISLHLLGDTVFTIPAVSQIIRHFQNNTVCILTFSNNAGIYMNYFHDVEFLLIKRSDLFFEERIAHSRVRKRLKKLNPDTIIDLTGNITSTSIIFNLPASQIFGTNQKYFRSVYDKFTPDSEKIRFIDRYLSIVKNTISTDVSPTEYEFPLNYSPAAKILIFPFAGWEAKQWSIQNFIRLARELLSSYEIMMIAEKGMFNSETTEKFNRFGIPFIELDTIEELIDQIKECSLFISNDTGPLHIAAGMGKPTFTIYGPTNPSFSHPFGDSHSFVRKLLACSPVVEKWCLTRGGAFCPSYECMEKLAFEEVFRSLSIHLTKLRIKKNQLNLS